MPRTVTITIRYTLDDDQYRALEDEAEVYGDQQAAATIAASDTPMDWAQVSVDPWDGDDDA